MTSPDTGFASRLTAFCDAGVINALFLPTTVEVYPSEILTPDAPPDILVPYDIVGFCPDLKRLYYGLWHSIPN